MSARVGRALRPGSHAVRQVYRGPGPVRPPGARRGDRADQLLRGGIGAGRGHGGRRGGQDGRAAGAVSTLDPTWHQVIYIANPAFGTRGLYVTIVRALGAGPRYLKAELMAQPGDLLAAETAERHRRVVLICDEAQLMQPDQLEELRLLTSAEMDSASPFAGHPRRAADLNRQLRMGTLAAGPADGHPVHHQADGRRRKEPPPGATTRRSPGSMSHCSPITPSPGCTGSPTACSAR